MSSFVEILRDIRDVKYVDIVAKHTTVLSSAAAVALQHSEVLNAYTVLMPHLSVIDMVPTKAVEAAASATSASGSAAQAQTYANQAVAALASLTNEVTLAQTARNEAVSAKDLANSYKDMASLWADKTDGEVASGRYSAKFWADVSQTYSNGVVYTSVGVYSFPDLVFTINGFAYRCIGTNVSGVEPSSDPTKWTRVQGGITNAAALPFTANGDLVSTNVQDVIVELRDDTDQKLAGKSALSHTHTIDDVTDWPASVTMTEVGYLDGLSGNAQSQIDGKSALSHTHTIDDVTDWPAEVTMTEVGYLDGLSGNVQAQIDLLESASFVKPTSGIALFSKVNAYSISIPVGTKVLVGTTLVTVSTTVTLSLNTAGVGGLDTGTKTAGTDYSVYALSTGEWIISASKTAPSGYTTENSRRVGGFHYGVIPEAFTAINNITSADATKIAGINQYSFWDLKFRPICDPSGMVHIFGRWYDIYLCNTDHHTFGTSAAGKTIAGGAVTNGRNYPKIPLFYGGDGSVTYGTFTWFEAAEIGKSHSKDMISYNEFVAIAYGVLENSSASTADTGITQHLANYTSKFGLCMATGCQWIWGKDLHMRPDGTGWAYHTETEGRGSLYAYQYGPTAAIFGGDRDGTSSSGSRASNWDNYVWSSGWLLGCRFACDHLELA